MPLRYHAIEAIKNLPGVESCEEGFGATEGLNVVASSHDAARFLDNLLEDQIDGLQVNVGSRDRCGTPHWTPHPRDYVNAMKCLPGVQEAGYTEYRSMPPVGRFSIEASDAAAQARLDAILSDTIPGVPAGNPEPGAAVSIYIPA